MEGEILAHAGRLLLEYNDSTKEIHRALESASHALSPEKCDVFVTYNGVAVSLGGEGPVLKPVRELRFNAALQARVHSILGELCDGKVDATATLSQLHGVEADTPRHPRWLVVLLLGLAAASLAKLLGADVGALIVVGPSTALGLAVRQQFGRRHYKLLALPLTAGFVGAVAGGLAIRLGWTQTPGLALIVPSLMVVPGPHLINGLLDLVDNFVPMGLARLGLAMSILLACTLGIVVGMKLTLPSLPSGEQGPLAAELNVFSDMILAGVVTLGFAAFYNASWSHIGLAMLGGMIGHGTRFIALDAGCRLDTATFLGALVVGTVAAWMARLYKLPVAVVSFAGAVTMMPGVQMYRALSGALRFARLQDAVEAAEIAGTIGYALQACLVVSALAMGLVIAARVEPMVAGEGKLSQGKL